MQTSTYSKSFFFQKFPTQTNYEQLDKFKMYVDRNYRRKYININIIYA